MVSTQIFMQKTVKWLDFYSPTDHQVGKYICRHRGQVNQLIPGQGCRAHAKFISELHQITKTHE